MKPSFTLADENAVETRPPRPTGPLIFISGRFFLAEDFTSGKTGGSSWPCVVFTRILVALFTGGVSFGGSAENKMEGQR
jgi:hypothetical protein